MQLTCSAFSDEGDIPRTFATTKAGGLNQSPPLQWEDPPSETRSFALVIVDRAPVAHDWVHWMVVDIPPDVRSLAAGSSRRDMPEGARELGNTFGNAGYDGPQPPLGTGPHRYEIILYALDVASLQVEEGASLRDFENAVAGHVLETGIYAGVMGR